VIVVGAGLAGLRCAQLLAARELEVILVERADRVGGRVASDVVDGFRIDRGFQLLNPSYPQARRALDLDGLALKPFTPGLIVTDGSSVRTLMDPLRVPGRALSLLQGPWGSWSSRLALARLLASLRFGSASKFAVIPDRSAGTWLLEQGIATEIVDGLLRPFLAGVLLEDRLESSAAITALLLRSFLRGSPGVPEGAMRAIPEQLAASLPQGSLMLDTPVRAVEERAVGLEDGTRLEADRVVLAVGGEVADELLAALPKRSTRSVTTWWFSAAEPFKSGATLVVDTTMKTHVNSVEMTAAAPSYAPRGKVLVAASALGLHPGLDEERAVRERLGMLHRVAPSSLELVSMSLIQHALPAFLPPYEASPAIEHNGILVAGDHVASPSIQGAMASGERVARAILASGR
jgi:phytoene dehydrogenase-like protein